MNNPVRKTLAQMRRAGFKVLNRQRHAKRYGEIKFPPGRWAYLLERDVWVEPRKGEGDWHVEYMRSALFGPDDAPPPIEQIDTWYLCELEASTVYHVK